MMKLYHGTSEKAYKKILIEGLICTTKKYIEDIYLTNEKNYAKKYGDVLLQIESTDLDQSKLYKHPRGENYIFCYSDTIPPNVIKVIKTNTPS